MITSFIDDHLGQEAFVNGRYGFKEFDNGDWDCYSGAEPLENTEPLIASFGTEQDPFGPWTNQYEAADLVIDNVGICLIIWDKEDATESWAVKTSSYEESISILYSLRYLDMDLIKATWEHAF